MKKFIIGTGVTVALSLLLSGCAGIISGQSQSLSINSKPSDALVTINGKQVGRTPISATIDKEKSLVMTVEKDGYETLTMPLNVQFDPAAIIGVISYSTPLTTDLVTGSAYEVRPNYIQVELNKK